MHVLGIETVADPGFPVGGGGAPSRWWGRQPLTWVLFGENICKNERIGSRWGGGGRRWCPPGSANAKLSSVAIQHV